MMLGGENQRAGAGLPARAGPLAGIERRRIEHRGVFAPVTPLAVGEGIDAEVEEQRQLVALPGELRGRGPGPLVPRRPTPSAHRAPGEGTGHRSRKVTPRDTHGPLRYGLPRAGGTAESDAQAGSPEGLWLIVVSGPT